MHVMTLDIVNHGVGQHVWNLSGPDISHIVRVRSFNIYRNIAMATENGHADRLVILGRLDQQHDLRLRSYLHEDFGPLPTPTDLRPKVQNPHGSPNRLWRLIGEQRCHLSHNPTPMPADGLPVGACHDEPLRPCHDERRKVSGIYYGHLHNRRYHDCHGLDHCKTLQIEPGAMILTLNPVGRPDADGRSP